MSTLSACGVIGMAHRPDTRGGPPTSLLDEMVHYTAGGGGGPRVDGPRKPSRSSERRCTIASEFPDPLGQRGCRRWGPRARWIRSPGVVAAAFCPGLARRTAAPCERDSIAPVEVSDFVGVAVARVLGIRPAFAVRPVPTRTRWRCRCV